MLGRKWYHVLSNFIFFESLLVRIHNLNWLRTEVGSFSNAHPSKWSHVYDLVRPIQGFISKHCHFSRVRDKSKEDRTVGFFSTTIWICATFTSGHSCLLVRPVVYGRTDGQPSEHPVRSLDRDEIQPFCLSDRRSLDGMWTWKMTTWVDVYTGHRSTKKAVFFMSRCAGFIIRIGTLFSI